MERPPHLDPLRGVRLERTLDLPGAQVLVHDWPGLAGPLVHTPDPRAPSASIDEIAGAIAPRYRVMSVCPRRDVPYQLLAMDIVGVLHQFGFEQPVLLGEGLGCLTALLCAAWFPSSVGRLILLDCRTHMPEGDDVFARSLRDCPPDWEALRCPMTQAQTTNEVVATLP